MEEETQTPEEPVEQTDEQDGLKVTVSDDIIQSIAYQEAAQVEGIVSLEDTFMHDILSIVRGGDQPKGVTVEREDEEVTIGLRVSVRYGVRIPQIILELRERITQSIKQMTGYRVKAINVDVNRVFLKDEESEAPAEESVTEQPEPKENDADD